MNINDFADATYETCVAKGFDTPGVPQNLDQKLLLSVGELVEAQNCLRDGRTSLDVWFRQYDQKPEGFRYELADAIIRILNIMKHEGIDPEQALLEKHAFNNGRPMMHGGKAF